MNFEVLMDHRENPAKCTIHPLKGRKDFNVRYFKGEGKIPAFESDLLLHVAGECLSTWKPEAPKSIAVIDCNWKKVAGALTRVSLPLPKLVKIPEGFVTAYPRRNKEGKDPEAGLATIEALFIAAAFLGVWDETLLENYHFSAQFLEKNEAMWKEFKLGKYAS
jgi:pre-rRNA-processing protein TSR3